MLKILPSPAHRRIPRLCLVLLALVSGVLPASAAPTSPTAPTVPTASTHPLLIGYFPQWGLYDQPQYTVKNLLTAHGAAMLDQVNYAQGFVTNGRCSVADPNADLDYTFPAAQSVDGVADSPTQPLRGNFNQFLKLKRQYPKLKLVLSLEGQAASFAQDAQPANREAFVASCVDLFLKGNLAPGVQAPGLFDGIDLDWEFPRAEDTENYLALLAEFRRQFDAVRPGLVLSIAVGHSPRMSGAIGEDMSGIAKIVDQVGLMTYDFTGPWSRQTGFLAPFSSPPGHPYGSVQRSVQAYLAAGVPAAKLIVGVPFYGYGWKLVPEDDNGLFQEGQPIRGDRPYSYIETLIPQSTVYRDPASESPWLFDGDAFWTYEDPTSLQAKGAYAVEQHLGGLMIWELGEDSSSATLLQSAWRALHAAAPSLAAGHDNHPIKAE
jgi:chitinase